MRQIVSLVQDGRVQYAIVDDDAGELTPFAEILLPNPDGFGLHEAAVLGTNLIQALGLNGGPRKRSAVRTIIEAEVPAELARAQTKAERRREANQRYHARQKQARTTPARPRVSREHAAARYQAITEYLSGHPDVTSNEVAMGVDAELYASVADITLAVRSDLQRLRERGGATSRTQTGPGIPGKGIVRWSLAETAPEPVQPPLPKWMTHPDIGPKPDDNDTDAESEASTPPTE